MKNRRLWWLAGCLLLVGCLDGPEVPYDQDNVGVTLSNQSGQMLVAVAAPVGTSFEEAVANHFVQSLGDVSSTVTFEYPNMSGEHDLWCFEQQYWIVRSVSDTTYIRDDNYTTATNRNAAGRLESVEGAKWYWSDVPGADPNDFEVIHAIEGDECFEIDYFVYGVEEDLSLTAEPGW